MIPWFLIFYIFLKIPEMKIKFEIKFLKIHENK